MNTQDLNNCLDYIQFDNPIEIEGRGFNVLGYFPYETSYIHNARIPRSSQHEIEVELPIYDNKYTIICQGTTVGCDKRFAMMFKDNWVSIGKWEDITNYPIGELKKRK